MTTHWTRAIAHRMGTLWLLKMVGTAAFMTLFFWAYFTVLEHPLREPVVVPTLWLDAWVPLAPAAFAVYISLWVYVSLAPALISNLRALLHYGLWVSALCLFCLAIFWCVPTQTPVLDIDWSLYPGLSLIKGMDAAGNALPSLHVGSAVFSAFWLHRVLTTVNAPAWLRWINVVHCAAIAWSTMATRQHVAWDVIAGAAVGTLFAWLSLRSLQWGKAPIAA
ncbi:phosphatase PAP2 family protein [Hydrogenophaga sp. PAMC20947]|uniref:phosphatase PAP2 family protein n=1 Tax=Hydrogenophaga sp. PAMC20947 TaxID=2565558 RepID=UPI001B34687E|nr:phosphatase PAP2 family protein [Hydrogenophaga sp. PAMC20947]